MGDPLDRTFLLMPRQVFRPVVFLWAITGVMLLLLQGLARLIPYASRALFEPRPPLTTLVIMLWGAFIWYVEGYRGFQRRFVPRVVRADDDVACMSRWTSALAAPAYALGLVGGTTATRRHGWVLVLGIAALVAVVTRFPLAWRGIVDLGVVAGLGWGALVLPLAAWFSRPDRIPSPI